MIKRLLDIVVGGLLLVLLAAPMLIIAVLIRRESPGASIFRQRRAGRHGKPFVMFKFRTMRSSADPYGASPRSGQDPRLTRVGKFLREKSLDELPQIVNVFLGQMSLVGPRPLYERQARQWDQRQRRRRTSVPVSPAGPRSRDVAKSRSRTRSNWTSITSSARAFGWMWRSSSRP